LRAELKFWSTKTKQEKQAIKAKHGVKVVTFAWIEKLYKESKTKTTTNTH